MSILDEIANPQVPNVLEGLRLMENIETSKLNRRMAEIKAGQALQEMQMQRQAAAQRAQGTQLIQQYLGRPQTTSTQPGVAREGIGPPMPVTTPSGEQQLIPAPAPETQMTGKAALRPLIKSLQNISSEQIDRATTTRDLADQLAVIGNEDMAKTFYDISDKAMERAVKLTQDEREREDMLFEAMGNNYSQITKLEEQGRFEEAQKLYNRTNDFIATNPLFAQDPQIQQFITQFKEYQPGLGKLVYVSSMLGKKSRDQFQKEIPKPTKYDTLNLYWPELERPVKGRFNESTGTYEYEKDGQWIKAPDNAEMLGHTTIQGTAEDVGLTKSDVSKINQQIIADDTTLDLIDTVVGGIEKNPQSVGFVGNTKEMASGFTGQFGPFGAEIAKMIESDDEIEVRSGINMLTGVLIPRVLNDNSGRYSKNDMDRVEAVNRGLKNITSPRQAIISLKTVKEIIVNGQKASKKMLGKETETFSITAPNGKTYTFPTEDELNAFKNAAGL